MADYTVHTQAAVNHLLRFAHMTKFQSAENILAAAQVEATLALAAAVAQQNGPAAAPQDRIAH